MYIYRVIKLHSLLYIILYQILYENNVNIIMSFKNGMFLKIMFLKKIILWNKSRDKVLLQ